MTVVFTRSLSVVHQVVCQHVHFFALAGCGVEPHFSLIELVLEHLISLHALCHRFRSNSECSQLLLSQLNRESLFARSCFHIIQTFLRLLVSIKHTSLTSDFAIVQLCLIVWFAGECLIAKHLPSREGTTHVVESHIVKTNPVGASRLHVETDFQLSVIHNRIDVHRLVDVNLCGSHHLQVLASKEERTANGSSVSQGIEVINTRRQIGGSSRNLTDSESIPVPVLIVVARHRIVLGIVTIRCLLVAGTRRRSPTREVGVVEVGSDAQWCKHLHRILHTCNRQFCMEDGHVECLLLSCQNLRSAARVAVCILGCCQHRCIHITQCLSLSNALAQCHGCQVLCHGRTVSGIVSRSNEVPHDVAILHRITLRVLWVAEVETRVPLRWNRAQVSPCVVFWVEFGVLSRKSNLVGAIALSLQGVLVVGLSILGVIHKDSIHAVDKHVTNLISHPSLQHIVRNVVRALSRTILNIHLVS